MPVSTLKEKKKEIKKKWATSYKHLCESEEEVREESK